MSVSQNLKERLFHAISTRAEVEEIITLLGSISSGGVASLNGETGIVNITAGANITVTPAGQNIQIAATAASKPSMSAYRTVNQTIPANSITTVVFDVKDSDTSSAYNTSTGVFTCPQTGIVDIQATLLGAGPSAGRVYMIALNGSTIRSVQTNDDSDSASVMAGAYPVTAGDLIKITTWHSFADGPTDLVALNILGNPGCCSFSVKYI